MRFMKCIVFACLMLVTSICSATTIDFCYTGWNTSGHGELYGTEKGDDIFQLSGGFIDDLLFGHLDLVTTSSIEGYLESTHSIFHYNNIINLKDNLHLNNYGLLFSDDDGERQLNLWGITLKIRGIEIGPLYTLCAFEDQHYVWSSFIDFKTNCETSPVPEPSTLMLFGFGIVALASRYRKHH